MKPRRPSNISSPTSEADQSFGVLLFKAVVFIVVGITGMFEIMQAFD